MVEEEASGQEEKETAGAGRKAGARARQHQQGMAERTSERKKGGVDASS